MEPNKKSSAKCGDILHKGSSVLSCISMLLIVAMFLRMESINRKTEMNELRISKMESHMEIVSTQTADHKDEMKASENARNSLEVAVPAHHHKQRRNAPTISLQQIRQEIDNKLSQACTSTDKLCQVGPQGPPGDPGNHGYPGYKGEKGVPGIPGPQGPLGPTGAQGPSGRLGPVGLQGGRGEKGDTGSTGSPGNKGIAGPMGRPGQKGSIGFKGNQGSKGFMGLQGPKGQCILSQKISVFPESQEVFVKKSATFHCWVQGATSKKITWRKLGDTAVVGGAAVLQINHVQRSHVGSYICTAYTGHGILKAVSSLRVKEPPVFINKPPSQFVVERGTTLSICCEAAGSPRPRIEWSRAQQSSDSTLAFRQENGCLVVNTAKENSDGEYICRATNRFGLAETTTTVIPATSIGTSCDQIQKRGLGTSDGIYYANAKNPKFEVFCDMTSAGKGWTLIARFSNSDTKNWMRDDGSWWYDQQVAMGTTTSPSMNTDMISPAFWMVSGREFKITRSDDHSHTPLLQTTGNCLAGQTFRSKLTSYGDFRNGKVWASNQCLGSCTVQYGGQYKSTHGFEQAECSGGMQSANKIGFWCDWENGDGSVMMIGGGGSCARADHGIGITEANTASFVEDHAGGQTEYDFGYEANTGSPPSQSYSLNLWIR